MESLNVVETEKARELLGNLFPLTERCTQYIACYDTKSGKQIAIERDRTEAYFVWIQRYEGDRDGIRIKNEKFPGQPYERNQPRSSNLNDTNGPKLKKGNKVWYLEVQSLEALKELAEWYSQL